MSERSHQNPTELGTVKIIDDHGFKVNVYPARISRKANKEEAKIKIANSAAQRLAL
jgi:hypothetical protein